jgi:hypothetical protein
LIQPLLIGMGAQPVSKVPWRDVGYPWERTPFARHEVFRV